MAVNRLPAAIAVPIVRGRWNAVYLLFTFYVFCLWLPAPLDVLGVGVSAAYLPLMLAVLISLFGGIVRLIKWPNREGSLFAFIICATGFLIVWCLLSGFQAESIIRVGRPIAAYAQAILVILLMRATLRSFEAQTKFAKYMIWIAVGMSAYVVASTMISPLRIPMPDYGDRIPGFFKHPNQFGIVLAMFLPIFVARASVTGFRKPGSIIAPALILLALFASGSKTNILLASATSAMALALTPILYRTMSGRLMAFIVNGAVGLVAFIAAISALAAFNPRAFDVINSVVAGNIETSGPGGYHSLVDRNNIWAYSINVGMENPIFGVGAGQELPDGTLHSHNVILEAFRTLGVPGALVTTLLVIVLAVYFGFYILNMLRWSNQSLQLRATYIGIALGGLGYLAANQISDSLGPSTSPFLWLFTGQLMIGARYFFYRS